MRSILQQLKENDYFNIICFHSDVQQWNSFSVAATPSNINAAISTPLRCNLEAVSVNVQYYLI